MAIRMRILAAATTLLWGAALAVTRAQAPQRTVWDGVYSAEQAARGAALYVQHCSLCHGPTLAGADGPPLTGVEFTGNWNGLTLGDLYERVRTSMPPDDPGKLSAQEKADVIAHILNTARFPAGMTDLPRDAQVLMQIRFVSEKP